MKCIHRTLVLITLLTISLLATSQSADTTIVLREVIIEAEAVKQALQYQEESIAAKVVAAKGDINNFGNKGAGEVLKRLSRITIDGNPALRNAKISGLDKEFQCILIDGNHPVGGEDRRDFKVDRIPVDLIERIEVVYNPTVDYGTDATTGVVNMILKKIPQQRLINTDLTFDYSSSQPGIKPDFTAMYGDKFQYWGFLGSMGKSIYQREAFSRLHDNDTSGTSSSISHVTVNSFNANVQFTPDSLQTITLETWYSGYSETEDMYSTAKIRSKGGLNVSADSAYSDIYRNMINSSLSYKRILNNGAFITSAVFGYDKEARLKDRMRDKETYWEQSTEDEKQNNYEALVNATLTTNFSTGLLHHKLKSGLRALYLNRDYNRIVYTKPQDFLFWETIEDGSYQLQETQASAYIMDNIVYKNWEFTPGLRLENTTDAFVTATDDGAASYLNIQPALHLKRKFNQRIILRAAITRQMARPPFLYMIPVDKIKVKKEIIERGNPDLLPSSSINISFSAEKYFQPNSFVALRSYYHRVKNMFEMQFMGIDDFYNYRVYQAVNIDTAQIFGAEVDTRLNLQFLGLPDFTLAGNYSFNGSIVRDPGTGELRPINEQPIHMGNLQISWFNPTAKLQIDGGIKWISATTIAATFDEFNNSYPEINTAPGLWLDGRVRWFFNQWGSVYVNALNILNEKTVITQGDITETMETGLNIRVGISMNL